MSSGDTSRTLQTVGQNGMRKGTRSCFECRRRKRRCNPSRDGASVCVNCKARGTECFEQKRGHVQTATVDKRPRLKDRVAHLEKTLQSLMSKELAAISHDVTLRTPEPPQLGQYTMNFATPSPSTVFGLIQEPTESIIASANNSTSETTFPQDPDPVASLFDNAIWKRNNSDPVTVMGGGVIVAPISIDGESLVPAMSARLCVLLQSRLPSAEVLDDVLMTGFSWWESWRPLGPWLPNSMTSTERRTLQEFVSWAFSSNNPSLVGLAILCIGVSIQCLDRNAHAHIIHKLPGRPEDLARSYFDQVVSLIVEEMDHANSLDGIRVIMMMAAIFVNLGQAKKSWALHHRAISYAQILGLHKSHRIYTSETETEIARRRLSWLSLCQADAYLSLLLGLPYAYNSKTIGNTVVGSSTTSAFQHSLIHLTTRVIDRNQEGNSHSHQETDQVQQNLDKLYQRMSDDFWNAPSAFASGAIGREEYFECTTAQFWYYGLIVLLQMPLMVKSLESTQNDRHRLACLEASREALKRYGNMRTDMSSAFSICKLMDYQAFIFSTLLLLGIFSQIRNPSHGVDNNEDWLLVHSIMEILRRAAETPGNKIAVQAVHGLSTLIEILGSGSFLARETSGASYTKITVPYSGVITICPASHRDHGHPTTRLSPQMPQTFTISSDDYDQSFSPDLIDPMSSQTYNLSFSDFNLEGASQAENDNFDWLCIDLDWASMVHGDSHDDCSG